MICCCFAFAKMVQWKIDCFVDEMKRRREFYAEHPDDSKYLFNNALYCLSL